MNNLLKATLILAITLGISGCSTVQPSVIDSKLSHWQGADIKTIIQTWGVPTKQTTVEGMTIAEWNTQELKNSPSFNIGVGGFGRHIFGSIGTTLFGGNKKLQCRVQVSYNAEGRVVDSNWAGDAEACDAAIPERI